MTDMADIDLVRKARLGDRQAFSSLYTTHAPHLFATCVRMVGDPALASELSQDALVKAWQSLDSYREESPFGAWLHRIAVNTALDYLRSRKRLRERIEFADDPEIYDRAPEIRLRAEAIDLESAIASLPPHAKTVLILHDIEGYRHEEIAAMMGTVEGTSKAQLHRARRLLKERLER